MLMQLKRLVYIQELWIIMMNKTYNELLHYSTYEDRLEYLKLFSSVGIDTFGHDRYLNQILYHTPEWKRIRQQIILRDKGCDLGLEGYEIFSKPIIHHINPITVENILQRDPIVFDFNNLITVSHFTHNAIHYGTNERISLAPIERKINDTCPWRK